MTTETTESVDLNNVTDDDLKAMGLPPAFTLDSLKEFLEDDEIDALATGDDAIVMGAEAKETPDDEAAEEDNPEDDDPLAEKPDNAEGDAEAGDTEEDPEDDAEGNATQEEEEKEKEPPAKPDPVFTPVDTSEAKQTLEDMKADRKALFDSYSDGDLTDEEFAEKQDAINEKIVEANMSLKDMERETERQRDEYQAAWYDKTAASMEAIPELKDQSPVEALGGYSVAQLYDEACRMVTGRPEFAHMSLSQMAEQAERITKDYFKQKTGNDLVSQAAAPEPAPAKDPEPAPKKTGKPDVGKRPEPVTTLGGVSSASEIEIDNSRFAATDSKQGMDAEQDFSRMSEAEQEAYLNGA